MKRDYCLEISKDLLKMFTCYTDRVNNNWLSYILAQFCYVQKAKFRFEVRTIRKASTASQFSLWYVTKLERYINKKRLTIPRHESYQTDDYSWHDLSRIIPEEKRFARQNIPIFRKTEHSGGTIPFDLFYNAFVHLSCLEEWEQERDGKLIHSYVFHHRRKNKAVYSIPIVNYLFLLLEHLITQYFGDDLFEPKNTFRLQLTHDVDYIDKTLPLRIKQSAFCLFNAVRKTRRYNLKETGEFLGKAFKFGLSSADYWQFEQWQKLEREAKVRSIFYVFARSSDSERQAQGFAPTLLPKELWRHCRHWLLDPAYSVTVDRYLQKKLRELANNSWEIGLHGSFDSHADGELLKREKEILENAIGQPVIKIRQHWLRFSQKTLRIQEEAGFEEDSTIGFNDLSGFRAGIASAYYPYDFEGQRAFKVREVPLFLMDSTLFDYMAENKQKSDDILTALKIAETFGGTVALDWHQRVLSPDYSWGSIYSQLMEQFCGK